MSVHGETMIHLHLDFETRSHVDIKECGLDNYARNASVLMLAYAVNDSHPCIWFPHETEMPDDLALYLRKPQFTKVAWNSAFERAILKHALKIDVPISQWLDPSCMARYAGLPSSLGDCSEALGMGSEGKDKEGRRLIRKFSCPQKDGTFKDWNSDPEDWAKFVSYCKQDVVAERAIMRRLEKSFKLPERERRIWLLDQKINEVGIPVDLGFVSNAQSIVTKERERLTRELQELTGLENPNSNKQMLGFLKQNGYPFESLGQKMVKEALA